MLSPDAAVVLLQHGGLDNLSGKTGLAMLRYRSGPIVAVIDPSHAGRSLQEVTGIERAVPVLASMTEALEHHPEVAVVGLAPSGGRLPDTLRADVAAGLKAGLSVASGLHSRLADDPHLAALVRPDRWIWDLRQEPADLTVATARAAHQPGRRLLAVGSDMAVGKMSACLELLAAARRRGIDCRFVGTGQAGILIAGNGIPLDAVRVDYAAGAVEKAVLEASLQAGPQALVLIEGQGSLCHPGSSATLPLLRGSQPTDLLLVHRAGQRHVRNLPEVPLPPLGRLIEAMETLASFGRPPGSPAQAPRVRAIALNTAHLEGATAARAIREVADETGLPCHDPVRSGGEGLLDVLLRAEPGP